MLSLAGQVRRFLGVGALNTTATFLIYQALVTILPPQISLAIAWLIGWTAIIMFYPSYVFRNENAEAWSHLWIGVYYLSSFVLSQALIALADCLGMHERLSVIAILAIVIPLNFLASRFIYARRSK